LFARGVHVNGRNHRRPDGAAISAATRNHRRPDDAAISTTTSFRPHVLQQSDEDKKTQEEKPRRRSAHRGTFLSFLISSIEPDLQKKSFLRMSKQRTEPTDASKRAALKTAGLPSGQKKEQALNAAFAAMVQQQAEGDGARPPTRGRTVLLRERAEFGARLAVGTELGAGLAIEAGPDVRHGFEMELGARLAIEKLGARLVVETAARRAARDRGGARRAARGGAQRAVRGRDGARHADRDLSGARHAARGRGEARRADRDRDGARRAACGRGGGSGSRRRSAFGTGSRGRSARGAKGCFKSA
jgi:hypothetical protein